MSQVCDDKPVKRDNQAGGCASVGPTSSQACGHDLGTVQGYGSTLNVRTIMFESTQCDVTPLVAWWLTNVLPPVRTVACWTGRATGRGLPRQI